MPRANLPWFRAAKNAWYVTLKGRAIALGVKGKGNRQQAIQAFAILLTNPSRLETSQKFAPIQQDSSPTVGEIVETYLAYSQRNFKPHTIRTNVRFLKPFAEQFGVLSESALTSTSIEKYAAVPTWSHTTRHSCLTIIRTAFRHCGMELKLKIPAKASRGAEAVISEQVATRVIESARGDFQSMLRFMWLTGCHPSEAFAMTLESVDWDNAVVILHEHKTKCTTSRPRFLYLTSTARHY